ncbi:MAG: lipoprotein-releasing ABC transporter permease subunit [Phenylobacterium sp.]|uniref:lipoprotein-releasing ABC transporter permease subunit n=2 Tax=Phenylobacterium sp. TaxID=1871053 RepID=UPI0025E4FC71|nr:lipoprotein-releasing ABC transporter permease subunit [Phenylobacterium sp.]MCA6225064.1 lipoprotein-releasing ABC transporter permease subunit [Phenylobacterium sp.]MCA6235110.1 lipoprotein-releasing ABC transporter permease subunit [Phenylobacterium sp.]MCA6249482.1 lipoprotein-releasing ABC transporter permease subunit [Phenylobacterium sp.]MCA6258280.1 lipoprotein-releasing ABC transporter permease subunit [Phenylobacterium sp.]MCA6265107.1 lipoprotein-releasing ABC transporter permeas
MPDAHAYEAFDVRPAGPFSRWERMVAGRYLRSKRREGGVAMIGVIAYVGIALAVAVLIIVMSVMNGFRAELLSRILGFNGHVFVASSPASGLDTAALTRSLSGLPGVVQAAPVIEGQVMAVGDGQVSGAIVRGVARADLLATRLVADNVTPGGLKGWGEGEYGGDRVLVGERLAAGLGLRPGDPITLISPTGAATAFGDAPQRKTFIVSGLFSVGMSEYDQSFLYMPIEQAALFFGREGAPDFIELRLSDPDRAAAVKSQAAALAGPAASVSDWTERNAAFWGALKVERNVMRLILMMLVVIAAANIISGLIMLVKNKGRDIAILRTMGAGQGAILRIFFMAGAAVGVAGALTGLLLGVVFCTYIGPIQQAVEWVTGARVFASDVYYLSRIPARIDWAEVLLILGWSLAAAFLATLPPAWRASRLDPVEALRYE